MYDTLYVSWSSKKEGETSK